MNKFFSIIIALFILFASSEAQAQGWAPGPLSATPNVEMCGPNAPFVEVRRSGTGNGSQRVVCDAEFGSSRTIYKMAKSDVSEVYPGHVVVRDAYGWVKFIGLRFSAQMNSFSVINGGRTLMVSSRGGRVSVYYADPDSGTVVTARKWSILGCLLPDFSVLRM